MIGVRTQTTRLGVWAVSFVVYIALTFGSVAQDFSEVVADTDRAVGRVLTYLGVQGKGTGSGFIFGRRNDKVLFLTNHHVIADGDTFFVGFRVSGETRRYKARVIAASHIVDLAVMEIDPGQRGFHRHQPLTIARGKQGKAVHVAAIGYPSLSEAITTGEIDDPAYFEATVTTGTISKVYIGNFGEGGRFEIVQHTADINLGNSGGPLIDQCASVVGVNTLVPGLQQGNGTVPQGTFWSSSNQTVSNYLRQNNLPYIPGSSTCNPANRQTPDREPEVVDQPAPTPEATETGKMRQIYAFSALLGVLALFGGVFFFSSKKTGSASARRASASNLSAQGGKPQMAIKIGSAKMTLTNADLARGVVLGRDAACDLQIEHKDISRRHARLSVKDRKLMIEDFSSSNGTTIGGKRIPPKTTQQINTSSDVAIAKIPLVLTKL